jgi:hypothetical protein
MELLFNTSSVFSPDNSNFLRESFVLRCFSAAVALLFIINVGFC